MTRTVCIALLALAFVSAAIGANSWSLHARLRPVAGASSATGMFDAQVSPVSRVSWRLSVQNLDGRPTRATLQIGSGAKALRFVLCQPCAAKEKGTFILIKPIARTLVGTGGNVLVATRAHPQGALRGLVKAG